MLPACTSTGQNTVVATTASQDVAYPVLPDTIITVPAETSADMPVKGRFAEASAVVTEPAGAKASEAAAQPDPQQTSVQLSALAADKAGVNPVLAVNAPEALPGEGSLPGVVPASFAGSSPQALAGNPLVASGDTDPTRPIHAPLDRIGPSDVDARSPELDTLISRYASLYQIPVDLVRRVVKRESTFNPKARNGPYWGLMQIRHDTAKGMGYRGTASGLLDAETNLKFAVRYLRGAFLVARGNHALADRLYQRGYYYDAKRAGMLDETGLGKDRRRRRAS